MTRTTAHNGKNGTAKTAKTAKGESRRRPVLSATVPAELKAALEREAVARGLPTLSAAVERVLADALAGADRTRRDDAEAAQLRRLDLRVARLEADLRARDGLIVEMLATLTRTFLAHTPPPGEADREALKRSAADRFDRLMAGVLARVERGESAADRVAELLDGVARQGGVDSRGGDGEAGE